MKYSFVVVACLTLVTGGTAWAQLDPQVVQAEQQRAEAMGRACRAAITIFADGGRDGGSGVVISPDGYALSNFHVTKAAGNAMKCGLSDDGRLYDAVIVGLDPVGDVALIKLLGRDDFPAAELDDSDSVRAGDWVFAVGNPFLLATDFHPTVTYGIVSGVHRYQFPSGTLLEYADCIQTDASINPGNSGGPLFNAWGRLIGINGRGSFEKRGRVNVGVGYAISINQIKNFLGHLKSGRILDHATLGARVADEDGRVVVADILDDSDAYRRGLRYGDEIAAFGGRSVRTANAFKNVLGIYPRGWQVPLSYRRDGKLSEIMVRLAGVHSEQELLDKINGRPPEGRPQPGDRKPEDPGREVPMPGAPPGDKPEEPEKRPRALHAEAHRPAPMPDIVRKHFEARRGYSNYYFNLLNRTRVWDRFAARGDFTGLVDTWTLRGQLLTANDSELKLSDQQVECSLPGGKLKLDARGNLSDASEPPGSGGMLAALYLWRRMLVQGPERFGEVHYVGTVPLAGHHGLVDVLVATYAAVQCQFYFDPAGGELLKMEMYLHDGEDPCELLFSQVEEFSGRPVPRRIEVRHADRTYATFNWANVEFGKAGGG